LLTLIQSNVHAKTGSNDSIKKQGASDSTEYPKYKKTGRTVDLFIWGGQSNAQGWQGDGAFYPVAPDNVDQYIGLNYTFVGKSSSNGWVTMQPQDGRFPKGHFGPEVSFARKLKLAGYNPAIFKFTCGGTSIYRFWKTPGAGGNYDKLVEGLKKAVDSLQNMGYKVRYRGFVWIQGESDADNAKSAADFYGSLLSIINDIRKVAGDDKMPVILGVDEQHPGVVKFPLIIETQQRLAKELPNVAYTSMIGLPKADVTHLTPAGLVTHGIRIFDAYRTIDKPKQCKWFPFF
jgi:hypothetical protein